MSVLVPIVLIMITQGARVQVVHGAISVSQIYFIEWGNSYGSGAGYIGSFSPTGVETRLSQTGGYGNQYGVAVDSITNTIFYSMYSPSSVWKASLASISSTQVKIWSAPDYPSAIALSTSDKLIFVDQDTSGLTLLSYNGSKIQDLAVNKWESYGLAPDTVARILYFTDAVYAKIWKVSYTPSGWLTRSLTIILSGTDSGEVGGTMPDGKPTGIILEGGTLYWIVCTTGEIRSMSVTGSSSQTVVTGGNGGVFSYGLAKKGPYFYYTSYYTGGVWKVTVGGRGGLSGTRMTTRFISSTAGITIV